MSNALRGSLIIGLLILLGAVAIGGYYWWPQRGTVRAHTNMPAASVPLDDTPQPDVPLVFQAVPPETAQILNAARPDYVGKLIAAPSFSVPKSGADDGTATRALDCLTAAIYYEARSESLQGQRAVAQVVLNRVRDPLFPASVCGVVFQGSERVTGCQFSFTCDGSLASPPRESVWDRTRAVARAALAGYVESSVGLATHYHTQWVVPVWRTDLVKLRTIGAHIFYGWRGRETSGHGLRTNYAGIEPPLWPGFTAYAAETPEGSDVTDPTVETFAVPPPAYNGPSAPSGVPAAALPTPLRADETRGALVTRQSTLKVDEAPVPLSQLGGTLPK